jgi:hypothetical protein
MRGTGIIPTTLVIKLSMGIRYDSDLDISPILDLIILVYPQINLMWLSNPTIIKTEEGARRWENVGNMCQVRAPKYGTAS